MDKEDPMTLSASELEENLRRFLTQKASLVLPISVEKIDTDTEIFFLIKSQRDGSPLITKLASAFIKSIDYRDLVKNFSLAKELGAGPFAITRSGVEHSFSTFDEFAEYIESSSRKGHTIQRYKGLGEMNPTQLWETTMDPHMRTLLQVHIEDIVEADQAFSDLMGDEVEPRREFIEQVALDNFEIDV
ncbi:MAG: DNA gyrase subunit B [bacterium ADurb.BinA186]|nr:MAG: DNA gyrase subunit B [bacterium ADurb.BinA186]